MSPFFNLFGVIPVRLADLLDILLVSIFFYYIFMLFRGTRAVQMFFGLGLLLLGWVVAKWWNLSGVEWLFSNLATVGVVALVILFQPEIRGALTRIGQMASQMDFKHVLFHRSHSKLVIKEIIDAVYDLARNNYGALIVIEKQVGLRNFADTGQHLDSKISARLLKSLFFPNSALHDGAVIISGERILAAGCILPLANIASDVDSNLGMRHRAARALAAESDAVVIVVSEETAAISVAYRNRFYRKLTIKELEVELYRHYNEVGLV